jgi:acetyl-CoA carboxylase, biotin carboxylase subunit
MKTDIQTVLVANRGAIARRIIRACREMGKRSVAIYSEADARAPYLAEASEAYELPGHKPADTYLNQDAILKVAEASGADAIHPGYGFLAENALFAQRVIDQRLTFIGPQPKWLSQMGDKVAARALLHREGFPVFPGSGLITDLSTAPALATSIGYPVMVKPTGGGGGMGMEVVLDEQHLVDALKRAQAIASSAFGESGVYLERWIDRPRHIEFQILGDGHGNAIHMYERECSVQRRNQKLIEESPAPGLDETLIAHYAEQAASVCAKLGYDNLGTLETLFDDSGEVGFLEMNTRIQVEHGVTEMVTGCDLVRLQIGLAAGQNLPAQPQRRGYAMEVRLYAEDSQTLLPSTGKLSVFRPPDLHGVRVETGYQQGQEVTPYYDAMLAKLIAYGETREMAIGRLVVALQAFEVAGVKTNAQLLTRILQHGDFLAGRINTSLVTKIMADK